MNYLAHFHLARASDAWIIGALLGEYVKGPLTGAWPPEWEQGIRLHRQIDAFSDQHATRLQFARLLPTEYRRYAGIVLDVYCDYLLSLHWQSFHDEALADFAERVYALLVQHMARLPPPAERMAQRLIDYDVL
ncbi:MAG TPA: ACP phosphodiesterase, partial [Spongiibacteraceae bacterium]|nr:ACP phosphodiesterase [Spongiibacteraceae bacterium]